MDMLFTTVLWSRKKFGKDLVPGDFALTEALVTSRSGPTCWSGTAKYERPRKRIVWKRAGLIVGQVGHLATSGNLQNVGKDLVPGAFRFTGGFMTLQSGREYLSLTARLKDFSSKKSVGEKASFNRQRHTTTQKKCKHDIRSKGTNAKGKENRTGERTWFLELLD